MYDMWGEYSFTKSAERYGSLKNSPFNKEWAKSIIYLCSGLMFSSGSVK